MTVTYTTRTALRERALHCCEVCGRHGANNAHHRLNRSQGGTDTLSNLLLVCGSGTMGCHGRITVSPRWARRHGYTVPSTRNPTEIPVHRWSRFTAHIEVVTLDDHGGITPITEVA